jgi:hypothetical protein
MQPVPYPEYLKDQLGFLLTIILGSDSLIQPKTIQNMLGKGRRDVAPSQGELMI